MSQTERFAHLLHEFERVGVDPNTISAGLAVREEDVLRVLSDLETTLGRRHFSRDCASAMHGGHAVRQPTDATPHDASIASQLIAALASPAFAQHAQSTEPPRTHKPEPTTADITVRDVMTRDLHHRRRLDGRARHGPPRRAAIGNLHRRRAETPRRRAGGRQRHLLPGDSVGARAPPTRRARSRIGDVALRLGHRFPRHPQDRIRARLGRTAVRRRIQRRERPDDLRRSNRRLDDRARARARKSRRVRAAAAQPSFAFWQRDNLRRYVDAKASSSRRSTSAHRRSTAPRARRTGIRAPPAAARALTVISMSNAAVARFFGKPLSEVALGAAGAPLSGHAGFIDRPTEAPAYNVVGIVRGSDPKLRNDVRRRRRAPRSRRLLRARRSRFDPRVQHGRSPARRRRSQPSAATPEETGSQINAILDSLRAMRPASRRFDQQRRGRRRQRLGARARARGVVSPRRRASRNDRFCSSGTRRKRRDSTARSTSPIIRPCRATRSSRRSTWIRWAAASRSTIRRAVRTRSSSSARAGSRPSSAISPSR